ncbi:MAG: peptidylprolyl isomerase [Oscillospiraceae bacterium]|nr:peptidylprolyl isomerase [Oscillospiraceae bacterium]
MSASAKKKLRKEETAAQLTEKQLKAQKETKKLKTYTTIFVAAIAVILVAGLIITGTTFFKNSGIKEKNTVAAVVDDYEFNSVEMSYYYVDTIESSYNEWYSSYGENTAMYVSLMMGLDITQPLGAQTYSDSTTWADYFIDVAMNRAQSDYVLSKRAAEEGFTMSEDTKATLEQTFNNLPAFATLAGYGNADAYLRGIYGNGANLESYRAYAEKSALAADYYMAHQNDMVIDDAAIRAHEAENFDKYSSFSFASYVISYSNFLTGGTTDENGNTTYSDAEKEAAQAAAKAAAESLPQCTTQEELDAAIAAISSDETAKSNLYNKVSYSSINTNAVDWMADSSRKAGDFTVIANESTTVDADGKETTSVMSYTAYVYLGREDNNVPLANVRHILVSFEGGTTDETGNTVYSDAEKAAAKEQAENLLALYEMSAMTEQDFADLATANTDDTGSAANGGLYEDIAPVQGVFVESFTNWSTDPAREAGDTGIIESPYGYHVMYYVGDDEMTYRNSMITAELRTEYMNTWYEEVLASASLTVKDTSALNRDKIISQAF